MATPTNGYWLDGKRLPSVTTILGRYKDSGSLIKWAYRQGREHERLQVTNDLMAQSRAAISSMGDDGYGAHTLAAAIFGGDWEERPHQKAPRDLYDKDATTAQAALAGTIAHDMIESYILGKAAEQETGLVAETVLLKYGAGTADGPNEDVQRCARNAFAQALEWLADTNIKVTHTELGLMSRAHKFGGTLDAVGLDSKGRIVLLDWKTSNAVYGDYLYQLAAYALLLEENHPELTPTGFHLLRFAKESADFAHHSFGELDNEKRGFLLMRELYEIDARTKKRA